MTVTFTTDLPDEDQPVLGNGVEDEVAVDRETAVSNNGSVRIQIRETGESSWGPNAVGFAEFIGAFDTLTMEFVGRLDGKEYEVRARTETDHVTGAWTTPVEIVTEFPGATGLSAAMDGQTQVSLSWTDNADNESGQRIVRERLVDGAWWPERVLGDPGPDAESFVDETVQPGVEYRYRVRPYTEYTSADSNLVGAETPPSGASRIAVPSTGWHVEVDGQGGSTRTPSIADPQLQPTINGYPSLRFESGRDETWQQEQYDDAPVRVWRDGARQPLDVMEHRDVSSESTEFEARGGTELDRRVVVRSDPVEPVAEFVERLIANETGYAPAVDSVEQQLREDVLLQAADALAELQAAFTDIPNDIPLAWDGNDLVPLQTAFVFEAEDANGAFSTLNRSDFSAGGCANFTQQVNRIELPIDLDYETDSLAVYVRFDEVKQNDNPLLVFESTVGESTVVGGLGTGSTEVAWDSTPVDGTYGPGGEFLQLSFNQAVETDENDDPIGPLLDIGELNIDAIAVVDDRYNYTFSNALSDGFLPGPELYPDVVRLPLDAIDTPLAISSATLTATLAGGGTLPEVSLREDGTGDYATEAGAGAVTVDYDTLEATAQGRVGIGRRDGLAPRDQTPRLGYEPQRLDSVELRADLDETPVLINRTFDARLVDVLRECMDVYDGAFEVREGQPPEVHVSRIDGRPVDVDPELVDVSVDRSTENAVDRAIVYAAAESIRRLPFAATVDEWVTLPLGDGRIVEGSEIVYDAATEDKEPLDRGDDYDVREVVGDGPPEVKLLTSVSEPRIDCEYKPRGEHERASIPDTPKELVEDAPELNGKQMADLAAFQAVEGSYTEAVIDATVELPPGEVGFNVIDALNVADLPGDAPYQVKDTDIGAGGSSVRLGAGTSIEEALRAIRERAGRVSERV